jgi:multidrug resistance efflux pump
MQSPKIKEKTFNYFFGLVFLVFVGFVFLTNIKRSSSIWLEPSYLSVESTSIQVAGSGRVQLYKNLGDKVLAGDPLFKLIDDDVERRLIDNERLCATLQNELEEEQKKLGLAMDEYLTASNDIDIKKQLEIMELAQGRSESASKGLIFAKKETHLLSEQQNQNVFKAPVEGVILKKLSSDNQKVHDEDEVYVLANFNKFYIETFLLEKQLAYFELGKEVSVVIDAYPNKHFHGKISWIGPSVDIQTGTIPIKIAIENSEGILKPGLKCKAGLQHL